MKAFLQGAWLGHPLHGFLVHIPSALWPAALIFDVFSFLNLGNPATARVSYYAMLTGLVVAVAAVVTGLADWWDIKPDRPARRLGLIHMTLNALVWVLFALNAAWRWNNPALQSAVTGAPLLLSLVAVAILLVSAYLGGRMVYAYGVSVARTSKERYRRLAQAGGARVAEK